MRDGQRLFVVSTGRSGTTSVASILSQMLGVECLHEPEPILLRESAEFRYGHLSNERAVAAVLKGRPLARDARGGYVESNQTLALLIPAIVGAFPTARFLWLMRDGRDFVASAMQKQWYTGHSENHDRYEDCPPGERTWIDWRIRGDLAGVWSSDTWASLPRFGKVCWYWSFVNATILRDIFALAPNRFRILRLESIDRDLREHGDWLGAQFRAASGVHLNSAKREPYNVAKWTRDEHGMFEEYCGPLMDVLYGDWRTAARQESARTGVLRRLSWHRVFGRYRVGT